MNEIEQENNYALRKIRYQETKIANICDLNLIGKEINQGDFTINISKDYFYSEEIPNDDAIKILNSSSIINLVGKNIVDLALSLNLAKKNSVKTIEGVPFLRMRREPISVPSNAPLTQRLRHDFLRLGCRHPRCHVRPAGVSGRFDLGHSAAMS